MNRSPSDSVHPIEPVSAPPRDIYIACPWTPKGGGMFKVADYLIQAQSANTDAAHARLRPLDTRGGGHPAASLPVLALALASLVRGRLGGRLAGVHVNMAERLSLVRKSIVIVACRLLGIPVVLHLHAAQLHHFYRSLPSPLRSLTRWVFSLPASCLVLGTTARRFVVEELGVPPQRVEIVINGVPEPLPAARSRAVDGTEAHPLRLLFVGNLSQRKGVSDLLAALAQPGFDGPDFELVLAGGGDIAHYRAQAEALGVAARVSFAGWCEQAEVARLMSRSDLLVLPSYDEGLPLVILEALAHGVPVLCTPVGEIPQVFTDGLDACFVTPGDLPGIAAALQRLMADAPLRHRLGRQGRALYEARFSLARFFDSIAAVHQRCFGVSGQAGRGAGPLETADPVPEGGSSGRGGSGDPAPRPAWPDTPKQR
ncbi:MAG: glycosyltransferase family 1 protein [Comamonadaceae bacterium]|nr:MAG: glycosyltransferase family 1 protein [Comamonadaceae bacterium]